MAPPNSGPIWAEVSVVAVVLFGVIFILVASAVGKPVDGTTLTTFGVISTYLVGGAVVRRRNGKGPTDE